MARLPYLKVSTATGDSERVLAQLAAAGVEMPILAAVANSGGAIRNFARMGNSLVRYTKLDNRLRELVILHLAVGLNCQYEWYEHERLAVDAGVTEAELEALRVANLSSPVFDDRDRAVLDFADHVVDRSMDEGVWARAAIYLDEEELADLVLAASWWGGMVPLVIAALGVEPLDLER